MFVLFFVVPIGLIAIVTYLFVSRRASPIPYFPSNKKDIKNIVQSLQLENDQIVYDLGAGDGIVIFAAATVAYLKKQNTRFVAIEINPILIGIMWIRRLFHPNRKNITVMYGDIFKMGYKKCNMRNTFFTYISPWFLDKVFKNTKRQASKALFVSYFYPVPHQRASRTIKGIHPTYVYHI